MRLKPAQSVALAFLGALAVGTILLLLPFSRHVARRCKRRRRDEQRLRLACAEA